MLYPKIKSYTPNLPYSQVANRRWGLNKRGGRKSTFKMEKFTLIYNKIIIDKANRWIILGKNASNRWQIGVFDWKEFEI